MAQGGTVEAYQAVTDTLLPGEISKPFKSLFGWHIVEVTGHRTLDETAEIKLNKVREQLLRQKQGEAFQIWQQRLRAEAYVIISDPDTGEDTDV
jgi:peptidyl-prolyl cis-trans isomerase SurA